MRKILLGLVAAAAIATPLAVTASAKAVDLTKIAVEALPPNPLLDATLTQPANGEHYTWSSITDHRLLNGKVGITAIADPGYTFTYGKSTLDSKVFTLVGSKFSYNDAWFGPVTCGEVKSATIDAISCVSTNALLARPANESSVVGWDSDFHEQRPRTGTLTYTVNAAGTGYTGQATYPNS